LIRFYFSYADADYYAVFRHSMRSWRVMRYANECDALRAPADFAVAFSRYFATPYAFSPLPSFLASAHARRAALRHDAIITIIFAIFMMNFHISPLISYASRLFRRFRLCFR